MRIRVGGGILKSYHSLGSELICAHFISVFEDALRFLGSARGRIKN
jgi:hypothetical protein